MLTNICESDSAPDAVHRASDAAHCAADVVHCVTDAVHCAADAVHRAPDTVHCALLRRDRRARRAAPRSAARARRGTADISPAPRCTPAPPARTPWGSTRIYCHPVQSF